MKNKNLTEFFRKYSFYIGVGFLTLTLIIIFRQKKLGEFVEEGKAGLASFYTQSLKPLIYTNEITNEDVFNFAMFNSLPVNKKENKILFVSRDEEGKNSISIQNSEYKENTDNYQNFIKYLELNPKGKQQFDSLLSYYKAKLYASVLSNSKNTIAVNQNIPLMHDLLYADILHFANTMNYTKAKQIYTERKDILAPLDIKKLEEMYAKNGEKQDYLLLNNDSLYTVSISTEIPAITMGKGNTESNWREEFNKTKVWANEDRVHNIEDNKDLQTKYEPKRYNNDLRVRWPNRPPPKDLEREMMKLNNLSKLSQLVTFEAGRKDGKKGPISFKMNFDISKVDSLVATTMDAVMQMIPKDEREKVKREVDSALSKSKEYRNLNSNSKEQLKNMIREKAKKSRNSDTTGKK